MSDYDRAYKVAKNQLKDFKYFYVEYMVGLIDTICVTYGFPLNQESIDGAKDAVIDVINHGIEKEWDDYGSFMFWTGLCPEWFTFTTSSDGHVNTHCSKKTSDFKEQNKGKD
jgi:hypothetical protein